MKTKIKKQWTQVVAVAAAAVCAVTATFAGVNYQVAPMDVYALESGAELPIALGDDGFYYVDCSTLTAEDAGGTVTVTVGTFDSSYINWGCNGCFGYNGNDDEGWKQTNWEASINASGELSIEVEATTGMANNASGIQVQFWYVPGEITSITAEYTAAPEETTTTETTTTTTTTETTTTTTDTTESSEDTTTTTTVTESSDSSEDTTTTTTVTESSDSSEDTTTTTTTTESTTKATTTTTTTTTESTTKATTTTTTTTKTTTTTASVTLETKISFSQEKDDDGNPCVKIDTLGADYVTVVMKVLTSDTQATLAYQGMYDGTWDDDKYEALSVGTDKLVVHTYRMRENLDGNALTIASYWPTSVTFQSITLGYDEAPVVTTPATTTTIAGDKVSSETVTVGLKNDDNDEEIVIDLKGKVLAVITAEGVAGSTIDGGFYCNDDEIKWSKAEVDSTGCYTIMYENVDDQDYGTYQIYYNGGKTSTNVTYKTYTRYDVSMNGTVNGSDVRALVSYLTNDTKTEVQNIISDINDDDEVTMTDAVALTKALLAAK